MVALCAGVSVYLAAFDETQDSAGHFTLGGFVGPETDWHKYFEPAWEERVLTGPPRIPYLHMTDIRDEDWRMQHNISALDASRRTDEAVRVLVSMGSLYPITASIDVSEFRTLLSEPLKKMGGFGNIARHPDYLAFIAFAIFTLRYVNEVICDATRVNFLAEESQKTTKALRGFHGHLNDTMARFPGIDRIFGSFGSDGKNSIPLQAADVFCWHLQRADVGRLHPIDRARFWKLVRRRGYRFINTAEDVRELSDDLQNEALKRRKKP